MERSPDGETVPREMGGQRRKMRRLGTRHASLGREDAEYRDGANGWFSLGCSAGSCICTSGAGVNYWGGSVGRKNNLAPQVGLEPTTLRLTADPVVAASCCKHDYLQARERDFARNWGDSGGTSAFRFKTFRASKPSLPELQEAICQNERDARDV